MLAVRAAAAGRLSSFLAFLALSIFLPLFSFIPLPVTRRLSRTSRKERVRESEGHPWRHFLRWQNVYYNRSLATRTFFLYSEFLSDRDDSSLVLIGINKLGKQRFLSSISANLTNNSESLQILILETSFDTWVRSYNDDNNRKSAMSNTIF